MPGDYDIRSNQEAFCYSKTSTLQDRNIFWPNSYSSKANIKCTSNYIQSLLDTSKQICFVIHVISWKSIHYIFFSALSFVDLSSELQQAVTCISEMFKKFKSSTSL